MKYFSINNELINLDNVLKISLKKDKEHMGDLDLYYFSFIELLIRFRRNNISRN